MHENKHSVGRPILLGRWRMPRWRNPTSSAHATVFYALALALLGAFAVLAAVGRGGTAAGQVIYYTVEIAATAGALARAVRRPDKRLAWSLLALGITLSTVGDVYWELLYRNGNGPDVSLADVFYLAFYPCVLASMILLMRTKVRATMSATVWLDGIISGLAAGALCAALTFGEVVSLTGGAPLTVTVNVAYPVGDLVLGSLVVAIIGMHGWRLDATWLWLLAGLLVFAVGDSAYLYQNAAGTYIDGGMLDTLWPLALLLIGFAGWQRGRADTFLPEESHGIALPTTLGALALLLLVYDHFNRAHVVAVLLAGATLAAMLARFVLTFRTSQRLLVTRRKQAITDQLTGIPNRRALMSTLERELSDSSRKRTLLLALFDLDGFKDYNDTFGHPAGDLLLVRLANRLDDTARQAGARAYRMGGDEFCLLARWRENESPDSLMALAVSALTESGDAFAIGASGGHALLHPGEVTVTEAMRAADQRMYQVKNASRRSAFLQTKDVLLEVLAMRRPELAEHTRETAELAERVARQLGLPDDEVRNARHTAQLHDIGKVAVPDGVLGKSGSLTTEEQQWLQRQTLAGERIALAAPALAPIAHLIRSSRERWDGTGYPDALAGDRIPLIAQIVAACDAYSTLRRGPEHDAALDRVRRESGKRFSPSVVSALVAVSHEPAARA